MHVHAILRLAHVHAGLHTRALQLVHHVCHGVHYQPLVAYVAVRVPPGRTRFRPAGIRSFARERARRLIPTAMRVRRARVCIILQGKPLRRRRVVRQGKPIQRCRRAACPVYHIRRRALRRAQLVQLRAGIAVPLVQRAAQGFGIRRRGRGAAGVLRQSRQQALLLQRGHHYALDLVHAQRAAGRQPARPRNQLISVAARPDQQRHEQAQPPYGAHQALQFLTGDGSVPAPAYAVDTYRAYLSVHAPFNMRRFQTKRHAHPPFGPGLVSAACR